MTDLSKLKCLVIDRGSNISFAQKLGESMGEVYYCLIDSDPYPESSKSKISTGLPEIERIRQPHTYIKKVDLVCFPDVGDCEWQDVLRKEGVPVFGSGMSGEVELDKVFFLEQVEKAGLPAPLTYRAEGIQEMVEYLKGKTDKYLKTSRFRGDFETEHYTDMDNLKPFINDLRHRLGSASDEVEILIQNPVKSEVEIGWDGFCVDGEYNEPCLCGYEAKDAAYVGKIFKQAPKLLKLVNERMAPIHKKLGCRGHFSTEIRITSGGKAYFLDPTERVPSPPGELMQEQITNYAQCVVDCGNGIVPKIQWKDEFGAQIVLMSDWYGSGDKGQELCVKFDDSIKPYVKLKNHKQVKKNTYIIVPDMGNGDFFGGIVATGKSVKQAQQKCLDILGELDIKGMHISKSVFDPIACSIDAGKRFGIMM